MIIQILSNLCDEGYLEKGAYSFTSPFFSGANVAFRREVFGQVGLYDESCATGEDHDICLRTVSAGWDLYFQPKALVRHKNKGTVRGFVRRWFNYGFNHPYIFNKHTSRGLQIYRINRGSSKGDLYRCIFHKRHFPLHVAIFATSFLAMHISLLLTIVTALLGFNIVAWILGSITVLTGIHYFKSDVDGKHPLHSIIFAGLRYAANLALLLGGSLGASRLKMIYISGTLDYKG